VVGKGIKAHRAIIGYWPPSSSMFRSAPASYDISQSRISAASSYRPCTEARRDSYIRALDVKLDALDEAFVDGLFGSGHASTTGFNDPGHPLEWRLQR